MTLNQVVTTDYSGGEQPNSVAAQYAPMDGKAP
jgi:hypothetical protein